MEQFFKMPKQKMPPQRINFPGGRIQGSFRNTPSLGSIKPAIDHFGKKPKRKHAMGPKMPLGIRPVTHGSDLRDLLHSTHTNDTVDRIKVGSNFNRAANLFDHAHRAGGMGAVRSGYTDHGVRIGQILK